MFTEEELIVIKHMALNNKLWAIRRLNKQCKNDEDKLEVERRIDMHQQIADKTNVDVIRREDKQ